MKARLHVTNRTDWRRWLDKHHQAEEEVWLVYYKKHTGKPRVPYNDPASVYGLDWECQAT